MSHSTFKLERAGTSVARTLPPRQHECETEANTRGERYVWLEAVLDRTTAMCGPKES
jgi:hypothetical protein